MNIRALQFFVAVVEQKSFVKAANLLYVTQPAISKSIKTLESELNCTLFKRDNNIISETDAGRTLYQHATNILNEINVLKIKINNINLQHSREITIGLPASSPRLFFDSLNRYMTQYPDVNVTIVDKNSKQLEQMIISEKLNIGIIHLPVSDPQLSVVASCPDRLVLVSSRDNLSVPDKILSKTPLSHLNFITLTADHRLNQHIQALFEKYDWHPLRVMQANSIEQILSIVSDSDFVSLLPASLAMRWCNNPVAYMPLFDNKYTYQTGVVVKSSRMLTQEETQLIEIILKTLTDHQINQDFFSS